MEKVKLLVLALVSLLLTFSIAFAGSHYSDLSGENQKYKIAAEVITEFKAVDYFTDGEYKPSLNTITKAEFIKALIAVNGMLDFVPETVEEAPYENVPVNHWAAGYITVAKERGLIREDDTTIFNPEDYVTYAYAITSALLSLGYNDEIVSASETTYPTNYMIKAVELGLTDYLPTFRVNDNLTRGDMALIFWNMLRTPIYFESESEGMTLGLEGYSRLLLNARFRDYLYMNKTYINSLDIANASDVSLTVNTNDDFDLHTAHVTDIDLQKLIVGEQVEVLIKQYKDSDNAKYIVVNPENTIVEGFVQNVTYGTPTTITINEESYTIEDDISNLVEFKPTDYLILEVNSYNNKVIKNKNEDEYVYKFVSTDGIFMETESQIIETIEENDLVIVDGNWASRDDVPVGSVSTKIESDLGCYFIVNTTCENKIFNGIDIETFDWNSEYFDISYFSFDDETYAFNERDLKVYEERNDGLARVNIDKLRKKPEDNEYYGKEATVYFNYLNMPVRIVFCEETPIQQITLGDMDGNNTVTIIDVRLLLQQYINAGGETSWTSEDLALMDMNSDEKIDIIDVRLLLQKFINGSTEQSNT